MSDDPIRRAVAVLNEALERDPQAITALVNLRVPCNERLAGHPLIRVGVHGGETRVGVLGLLNGALGASPSGVIGAKGRLDAEGRLAIIECFVDLREDRTDLLA